MKTATRFLLTCHFAFSFYCTGALAIENEVNYNTWHMISSIEFSAYHFELERLLKYYLFLPLGMR